MFDKLVQKTQQLKENIKEQIAVGIHEKLEGVPFANRLFPGAGLAVRAYMRQGDAIMQAALHPDRSFASRQSLFDRATREYDMALNLAGRAYGVSKYLDNQAEKYRVACVNGIPSAKLIRTKFGDPVRAASREPFLRELAFRRDVASGCSNEAKSIIEIGIGDEMRESFLDRATFVTQNYARLSQHEKEPKSWCMGSVSHAVCGGLSAQEFEISRLFDRIKGEQLSMKDLCDMSKQITEACDKALSLFGRVHAPNIGAHGSRVAYVSNILKEFNQPNQSNKEDLERIAFMGDIASRLADEAKPFLDQVGYQLDKVEKNILARTASLINDYEALEAWSLSSGDNKTQYNLASMKLRESLSEAIPVPARPDGISARKFVEGLTGTGDWGKAAAELLQEGVNFIKPNVTLSIKEQDTVLAWLDSGFSIGASHKAQTSLLNDLLQLINSFEKPATTRVQPVSVMIADSNQGVPPASGLESILDRDERSAAQRYKDQQDWINQNPGQNYERPERPKNDLEAEKEHDYGRGR